jgi:arylsulfatase A-like enzyme
MQILRIIRSALLIGLLYSSQCSDALASDTASLAGSRPNIVVIITDDQGYAQLGRHGQPWIRTPNMNRLHDESTRFSRFLVSPTCAPTRAALMTGRHPMRNGITHTILERERLALDAVTLPEILQDVGYQTGIFGKWHLGDQDPYQPQNRGFDEAFIHGAGGIGQAYLGSCADAPGNKYFDPVIRHNGAFVKTNGYCTDLFFQAALGWIRQSQQQGDPFFAYIATNAPHGPFIAPPENAKRFEDLGMEPNKVGFYGMVENIDENIGRLMAKLDEWHLLDSTLVIFMSDNGTVGNGSGREGSVVGTAADGTELLAHNDGMRGYKGAVDEGGVRVPFFMRWNGRIAPGQDVDNIAAHIDLLPTLAELAGAKTPVDQVEGRSLLPLLGDGQQQWKDRYLFTHAGRWKLDEEPNDYQWKNFAVRDQRYRFVQNKALYDMQSDPGQETNIIDEHPDVVESMRTAYDQWWQATRPLMVNEHRPLSKTRPFHEDYYRQQESKGIPVWKPASL